MLYFSLFAFAYSRICEGGDTLTIEEGVIEINES